MVFICGLKFLLCVLKCYYVMVRGICELHTKYDFATKIRAFKKKKKMSPAVYTTRKYRMFILKLNFCSKSELNLMAKNFGQSHINGLKNMLHQKLEIFEPLCVSIAEACILMIYKHK